MSNANKNRIIVGLDIGTSKVVAIVGEINPEGRLEIIGLGSHGSKGLKKGVVVNIESTVQSIQRAIEEAELMAGCQIQSVYAGIAGSHIRSMGSHGIVAIRDREVFQPDIDRVIDAAQAVAIPADQKILHILPQEFIIDTQEGVKEPLGMSGVRLEAKVHLVTCAVNAAQNIEKCIKQCGLGVDDIILEQLASSYSVLTEDEKDLGVCMVDIGTPTQNAEEIKIKYACALGSLAGENETIKVPSVGEREDRSLSRQALAEVVEPRYEELFTLIQAELRRSGFEDLIPAGIVLTGGASKMEGVVELAEEIFHMPVSIGKPKNVSGLELAEEIFHMPVSIGKPKNVSGLADIVRNPIYATAVGLLQYGAAQGDRAGRPAAAEAAGDSLWSKVKQWLLGNES